VRAAELEMSIAGIENQCNRKLSAVDSTAVAGHLRTYFNGKPANYFRQIFIEDLAGNASLSAIGTILQRYGCGLGGVAVANPISCARDTTLYLEGLWLSGAALPSPAVQAERALLPEEPLDQAPGESALLLRCAGGRWLEASSGLVDGQPQSPAVGVRLVWGECGCRRARHRLKQWGVSHP
jgi:hypothetical protein